MGIFDIFKKKEPDPRPAYSINTDDVIPSAPAIKKSLSYRKMQLESTESCKDLLLDIAKIYDIKDGNKRLITYEEAFRLYYSDSSIYFPWEFPINNLSYKETPSGFAFYGDDIYLGDIHKSKASNSDYRFLSRLISFDAIDRLEVEIKNRSSYFHITSYEYHHTAWFDPKTDDPFNRGTNEWFDDNTPTIYITVYYPSSFHKELNN